MIFVTKSFKPDKKVLDKLLSKIRVSGVYTNRGPLVRQLELDIANKLGTKEIICMANGTLTLQILVNLFAKGSEVITTPFTYVATLNSILWSSAKPVFVDIDPSNFNINADLIEASITPQTRMILVTHVFGIPCDVIKIQKIAEKYNLIVVYDAAHCFGVKYLGESLFNYGNFSSVSFHATKIFHTVEGGGIFINDTALFDTIFQAHNFGHLDAHNFVAPGINAKMSEIHAAFGLSILPNLDKIISKRRVLYELYIGKLNNKVQFQFFDSTVQYNYSYMPVLFDSEVTLLKVIDRLTENDIVPRRYFYPSLNTVSCLGDISSMPISENIASRILCLPLYYDLSITSVNRICRIINSLLT
jgi:dTDP-4-amino-4,6-dideoxygalactose transaminase